jgi:hypothetical protein
MWKELFSKWFGLDPRHCEVCEVLRTQLEKSEVERKEYLHRLLDKDKAEPSAQQLGQEEFKPVIQQHVSWRVRQQMLEAEDRKKAQLMKSKAVEIAELEKELKIEVGREE